MSIADFNNNNGTSYTKESFTKLFNQYFPKGMSDGNASFEKNYQTMYQHALRFAVRSCVFGKKNQEPDLGKLSYDLNGLFKEQIAEYNKEVPESKAIKFLEDGGMSKAEIKGCMLNSVPDIPKTQLDEEIKNIRANITSDLSMTPEENYNQASYLRLNELFDKNNGIDKKESYSRSIDVIRAMKGNHELHEKTFKHFQRKKSAEEIKGIENAKDIIKQNGYSLDTINADVEKQSPQTDFYKKIVSSIDEFKPPVKESTVDLRKMLEESLGGKTTEKTTIKQQPSKTFGDPTINVKGK